MLSRRSNQRNPRPSDADWPTTVSPSPLDIALPVEKTMNDIVRSFFDPRGLATLRENLPVGKRLYFMSLFECC